MARTVEEFIAKAFSMSDAVWERHANPLSVWTRYSVLPILVIAFWSRIWLGWWCIICVAVAMAWVWINPRLFQKPKSTDNWASKAVLGERVWLNRKKVPVPKYHRTLPNILSIIASIGMVLCIYGVVKLQVWPTVFGIALAYLGKSWFLDRMVWLYEDMKETQPEYKKWLY
jgi:hypothetical protein